MPRWPPILDVYRRHGFGASRPRPLESLRLLTGGEGGENEKLIYKVLKRGEKLDARVQATDELADLGLRFDLTVPLARYYAHNHARLPSAAQGHPDRAGVARRAATAGPVPPVHPVRHRHPRRGVARWRRSS